MAQAFEGNRLQPGNRGEPDAAATGHNLAAGLGHSNERQRIARNVVELGERAERADAPARFLVVQHPANQPGEVVHVSRLEHPLHQATSRAPKSPSSLGLMMVSPGWASARSIAATTHACSDNPAAAASASIRCNSSASISTRM